MQLPMVDARKEMSDLLRNKSFDADEISLPWQASSAFKYEFSNSLDYHQYFYVLVSTSGLQMSYIVVVEFNEIILTSASYLNAF